MASAAAAIDNLNPSYNRYPAARHAVRRDREAARCTHGLACAPKPPIMNARSLCLVLYTRLEAQDAHPRTRRAPLSPASRRALTRVLALFAIDGGGFLTTALVSYFFLKRFGVGGGVVAALFFVARVANQLSHFAAAALARRIGLVSTMLFTHMPSSVLSCGVRPQFRGGCDPLPRPRVPRRNGRPDATIVREGHRSARGEFDATLPVDRCSHSDTSETLSVRALRGVRSSDHFSCHTGGSARNCYGVRRSRAQLLHRFSPRLQPIRECPYGHHLAAVCT